ncbi:hypothetical protein D3C81_834180 [compost metagenome]
MHFVVAPVQTDPATISYTITTILEQIDGAWQGSIMLCIVVPKTTAPASQAHRLQACDKRAAQYADPNHHRRGGSQGLGHPKQMLQCFVLVPPGPVADPFEHIRAGLDNQLTQ